MYMQEKKYCILCILHTTGYDIKYKEKWNNWNNNDVLNNSNKNILFTSAQLNEGDRIFVFNNNKRKIRNNYDNLFFQNALRQQK